MLVFEHDADNLKGVAERVVSSALRAVEEFATFHESDEMVDFDVPPDIGVGIARGAASRLESDEVILDYARGVLNLAARLMDVARPRGVVFARFTPAILGDELAARFASDSVYLRGVAEEEPLITSDGTVVPAERRRALAEYEWVSGRLVVTHKELRDGAGRIAMNLDHEPADSDQITLTLSVNFGTQRNPRRRSRRVREFGFGHHAGKPRTMLHAHEVAEELHERRLPLNRKVTFTIAYPIHRRPDNPPAPSDDASESPSSSE